MPSRDPAAANDESESTESDVKTIFEEGFSCGATERRTRHVGSTADPTWSCDASQTRIVRSPDADRRYCESWVNANAYTSPRCPTSDVT